MKIKKYQVFCFTSLSLLLLSCQPKTIMTRVNYTKLEEEDCAQKPNFVSLYFEGEQVPFNYKKLGTVEVTIVQDELAYDLLKEQTRKVCGDAIIQVRKDLIVKNYTDDDGKIKNYTQEHFRGIAVKVDESSSFSSSNSNKIDTTFSQRVHQYDENLNSPEKKVGRFFASLLIAVFYGLIELAKM